MKNSTGHSSKLLARALIMFGSLTFTVSNADNMRFTCGPNGELKSFVMDQACGPNNQNLPLPESRIALTHPYDSLGKNKASSNYDKTVIDKIIRSAISVGVDPYAALAILIMENPPLISSSDKYSKKYGSLPLDAIAIGDLLGCKKINHKSEETPEHQLQKIENEIRTDYNVSADTILKEQKYYDSMAQLELQMDELQKDENQSNLTRSREVNHAINQLRDDHIYQHNWPETVPTEEKVKLGRLLGINAKLKTKRYCEPLYQDKPEHFDLTEGMKLPEEQKKTEKLCINTTLIKVGDNVSLQYGSANDNPYPCCAIVTYPLNTDSNDRVDVMKVFKDALGPLYIKKKIQDQARHNPSHSLPYYLQAFNGYGCFGCTEKMQNSCLQGINMSERPVYGATAADIMANMLMDNSTIRSMVSEAQKKEKKPLISILCLQAGPGSHQIDSLSYALQEEAYLTTRDGKIGSPAIPERVKLCYKRSKL